MTVQLSDVAVFQRNVALGDRQECRQVRGQQVGAFGNTDDQRTAPARRHHVFRVASADNGNGVAALEVRHGSPHRFQQRIGVAQMKRHVMRNDLRIRLGAEPESLRRQLAAQIRLIFDDSVVDHGDGAAGGLGVCVDASGLAMGGPAGMPYTHMSRPVAIVQCGGEALHRAYGTSHAQAAFVRQHGHAG